ncbi:MAG: hypothetical protein IJX93_11280 [Clostridia bacterium]|nr:hypothetical protein [Clostridia bacterium]MBQ8368943.1 hypothetical protein [Clostridia bacterium]MBQ8512658.1 hypothetical protein [Clostridia bacterium]
MEHIDMMEKLHEKANISLSEAKEVLERADWDMLEALVILEKEGKIQPLTTSVSTMENESAYKKVESEIKQQKESKWNRFWDDAMENLKNLVNKCFTCSLVMRSRKSGNVIHIPLFLGIILCFVSLNLVAIGLLLGLILGYDYFIEENKEDK